VWVVSASTSGPATDLLVVREREDCVGEPAPEGRVVAELLEQLGVVPFLDIANSPVWSRRLSDIPYTMPTVGVRPLAKCPYRGPPSNGWEQRRRTPPVDRLLETLESSVGPVINGPQRTLRG
jgi:hypothetical protein